MIPPPTDDAVRRWRADTPGVEDLVHLNNAGAALVPRPVAEAVTSHLRLESELGGYEAADARAGALQGVRASLARLIGAAPRNLALTQNSTVAFA